MGLFSKRSAHPQVSITDATTRRLVRMATADMNYGAVQDLYARCVPLVPPGVHIWTWWVTQVEQLAAFGDPDARAYAQFARDAAFMDPWGEPPQDHYDRLNRLG